MFKYSHLCFRMGIIKKAYRSGSFVRHHRTLPGASFCCKHNCIRQSKKRWKETRTLMILLSQWIKPHPKSALILCFSIRWNNKSPLLLKPVCIVVSVLHNESIQTNTNVWLWPSCNVRRQIPRWYQIPWNWQLHLIQISCYYLVKRTNSLYTIPTWETPTHSSRPSSNAPSCLLDYTQTKLITSFCFIFYSHRSTLLILLCNYKHTSITYCSKAENLTSAFLYA